MIETVVALCLMLNNKLIEQSFKEDIGQCLMDKRVATRSIGEEQDGVTMSCDIVEAETEVDMGRKRIIKIVE